MISKISKDAKRRLLKLAKFLDKVPPNRFNYEEWIGEDWKGKADLSCGTTACAAGWATTIPEFRNLGLHFDEDGALVFSNPTSNITHHGFTAVAYCFDLAESQAHAVFGPMATKGHDYTTEANFNAQDVAAKIRRFVLTGEI